MIDSLAATIAAATLLAAVAAVVGVISGRYRWRWAAPALIVAEGILLVQSVLAVIGLIRGHHPREPATFLAYLAVSVLVLPAAIAQVRGDDGRWSGGVVAVAFAVVCVVVIRAQTTWRSG